MLACTSIVAGQEPAVFRARTDVVLVPISVTDRNGRFVRGLTSEHFEIWDGGTRRAVKQFSAARVPVSLIILLDISGSMMRGPDARAADDARWADTRRALETLVTRLDAADELLFAVFNDQLAASPWTQDRGRILDAFDGLRPSGGTALLQAITEIAPAFRMARHQRKVLLLISDGNDTQRRPLATFHRHRLRSATYGPLRRLATDASAESSLKGRGMPCAGRMRCCMPSASVRAEGCL